MGEGLTQSTSWFQQKRYSNALTLQQHCSTLKKFITLNVREPSYARTHHLTKVTFIEAYGEGEGNLLPEETFSAV